MICFLWLVRINIVTIISVRFFAGLFPEKKGGGGGGGGGGLGGLRTYFFEPPSFPGFLGFLLYP